jgi:hypothetical protein
LLDPDLMFYVQFEKHDALVAFGNSTKPGCNQTVTIDGSLMQRRDILRSRQAWVPDSNSLVLCFFLH